MPHDPGVPSDFPDQVDEALAAFWSGEYAALDQLLEERTDPAPAIGAFFRGVIIDSQRQTTAVPEQIAAYQIIRPLGQGGMGVVYEARQHQPDRLVALKVVRGGHYVDEHLVKLFQREIQALARLQHPSIAAIYEAGRTDDGHHYFAMELVRGVSLVEYVGDRSSSLNGGPLGRPERLELFLKLCDAISFAHQRGVIHRDLKPSNILVPDGSATRATGRTGDLRSDIKVLDFGLAQITGTDVALTTVAADVRKIEGTLPYMSPEQVKGDSAAIDVRCDVYSLGVILYELMTDQLPYNLTRADLASAARIICDQAPTRPAQVNRQLRGDLETIMLKAIEKEPDRRYQNVPDLAEDVRRYLRNDAIQAKPPTLLYSLRKLAFRNKAFVLGAIATTVTLVLGIVCTSFQAYSATRERDRAVQAERRGAALAELWASVLGESPIWQMGNAPAVEKLLDEVAMRIDTLGADPLAEASMRLALGKAYRTFGTSVPTLPQMGKAENQLERAYRLRADTLGSSAPETVEAMIKYSSGFSDLVRLELAPLGSGPTSDPVRATEARELRKRALDQARVVFGENDPRTLAFAGDVAKRAQATSEMEEACVILKDLMERQIRIFGEESLDALESMDRLATLLADLRRRAEAEPLFRRACDISKTALGPEAMATNDRELRLAQFLWDYGSDVPIDQVHEAAAMYGAALDIRLKATGDEDPHTLMLMHNYAALLMDAKRFDEAEKVLEHTIEKRLKVLGASHGNTIRSRIRKGGLLVRTGRAKEAEPYYQQLLSDINAALAPGHVDIGVTESLYGECLAALGRNNEAEAKLLSGYQKIEQSQESTVGAKRAAQRLAKFYASVDRHEEAAEWTAKAQK